MPNTALKSEQLVRLAPPDDLPLAREAVFEFDAAGSGTRSPTCGSRASAKQLHEAAFLARRRPPRRGAGCAARRPRRRLARRSNLICSRAAAQAKKRTRKTARRSAMNSLGRFTGRHGRRAHVPDVRCRRWPKGPAEQMPLCGGPHRAVLSKPSVAAIRGVLTVGARRVSRASLAKRLADIEAAGFLEEFVWVGSASGSAGGSTPPQGLDARRLQAVAQEKPQAIQGARLRHRRPSMQPRPMPIEPAEAP